MGCMKILLNFPGEAPGDLAHDLPQQMITTGLHQLLGEHGDHLRQANPNAQIQVPLNGGGADIVPVPRQKPHAGLEIDVVVIAQVERLGHHSHRFNPVHLALLRQKPQGNGGFDFEAEIAELSESQGIGLLVNGLHAHRRGAALKPGLVIVEVGRHRLRRRHHLHGVREAAAVAAHLGVSGVAQIVGVGARQKHHDGWSAGFKPL